MNLFLKKTFLFSISIVLIFYIKPVYYLINEKYQNLVAGREIYVSIKKSKEKSNKKTLLIGDSVGRQLFNNENDSDTTNSLACNQAIGVIGQYFLLNNYIKSGNRPQEVFLVYTPFSFRNNLDQIYTFHYFLKPFYKQEYLNLFTETALSQIDKIQYSNFCHEPHILTSNWAPKFECKDNIDYTFLSPISKEYLEKIKKLCISNNIEFYIIPTPTKESNKKNVLNFSNSEISNLLVKDELRYFLNNVNYFPDSLYIDNVHLKSPEALRDFVLKEMNKARTHNKRS